MTATFNRAVSLLLREYVRALRCTSALALGMALAAPACAQDAQTLATTVCAACHGPDGNSVVPMFPKIAGLQETYIIKQLRDFQSGRRKSDIMAPVVATLKPEDMAPLARFFSAQKRQTEPAANKAEIAVGKLLYFDGNEETGVPACVGCHQAGGAGQAIYPRIGGQHATYLAQQLRNFAAGERSNDVSRFMRVVAKRMSEEEIVSVSAYLVSLDTK
jgi:cytochrome c553